MADSQNEKQNLEEKAQSEATEVSKPESSESTTKETETQSSGQPIQTTPPTPKQLSPEEAADLERRRKVFRSIHETFTDLDTYEAEGQLTNLVSYVEANWQAHQSKVKVSDSMAKINESELGQKVYELVKDSTVEETVVYLNALNNAIKTERFNKTKTLTVKDIGIKLL